MNISGKKYLLILGCVCVYTAIVCYSCERELTESDLTFDLSTIPYTVSIESDEDVDKVFNTPEDESLETESQSPLVFYFDNDSLFEEEA